MPRAEDPRIIRLKDRISRLEADLDRCRSARETAEAAVFALRRDLDEYRSKEERRRQMWDQEFKRGGTGEDFFRRLQDRGYYE